ncbi:MAG TPA: hypothetical protein PLK67_07510 [Bryobacteraceae bacterium]|nr:hypothetical protein [Bryobacteraceae bacterium]
MRVSIPGVSREALAGAIAEELPGGAHVAPWAMDRLCEAVPELNRRDMRRKRDWKWLLGDAE